MIHEVLILILAVCLLGLIFIILTMFSAIRSIRRQVHFIAKNDTNKKVTFYGQSRGFNDLAADINDIIDSYRAREIEISRQDAEIKDTLTNMSHDIRTPLTSLKGYFELMNETDDPAEKDKYAKIINERIDSLSEILETMFFYTKVSGVNYKVDLGNIDMSKITLDTLFSYYDDFEKYGMEPEVNVEEGISVIGNEQSIKRILQNLIKNCFVHGKERVSIDLHKQERSKMQYAVLSISNMLGEEAPDPSKVFDRFYKGDTSRHVNSSGIGLSVVKKLVDAMNGIVEAEVKDQDFVIRLWLHTV
ncbi:MAG: HAMP domain-containing histidine kinase [Clostridiales bacterium]|nr:HAMP domain-containing histidine kinase [Clostridiales bacterium]